MKNNILKYFNGSILLIACFALGLSSCGKDDYYRDGGKADPKFNGSILQYLESKPNDFDSIVQVIKIAGLEEVFTNEKITFFAPNDKFIKFAIRVVNPVLSARYIDTIKTLADIKPEIWQKYLLKYVFKGEYKLADYPQLDLNLKTIFPGQNYFSYNGAVFNIGLIYNDVNGVKYIGYRELAYHFIPDISMPMDNWTRAYVSSTDILPNNGVVHALAFTGGDIFGFELNDFYQDILLSK